MGKHGGFQKLGLDVNLLKGVLAMYSHPTPVQREVLPVALSGRDVACMARTGAGKTASFLIPTLQIACQAFRACGGQEPVACILSPTRELALQTHRFALRMSKFCFAVDGKHFSQAALVGGEAMEAQFDVLSRRPATLIATPGRLAHLLQEAPPSLITLAYCRLAVFDEADRLFEMGFALQLRQLLDAMPKATRQTLLFSATMPRLLAQFARAGLRDNVALVRLEAEARLSDTLRLAFFTVRTIDKPAALCAAIRTILTNPKELTIIFAATRHHCEHILAVVAAALPDRPAATIYGAMDQEARTAHLRNFRKGSTRILIVTDVAARGLDIPLVENVINYHMAPASRLFVHRCGRAARQGRPGVALSLVDPEELPYLVDLHTLMGRSPADAYGSQLLGQQPEHSMNALVPPKLVSYTRTQGWTPDHVHYGSIPQTAIELEAQTLAVASQNDDGSLIALARVANNAMQQYRKTRPAASKRAVAKAKSLRLSELHPLFLGEQCGNIPTHESALAPSVNTGCYSLRTRLAAYRPNQSILEMRLTAVKDEGACREAAKIFRDSVVRRKALHDERAKSAAIAFEAAGVLLDAPTGTIEKSPNPAGDDFKFDGLPKRRLSKAERKAHKSGDAKLEIREGIPNLQSCKAKTYIKYGNTRAAEIDDILGDHRQRDDSAVGAGAAMLESALLDIAPDEALDMVRKRSMYRWDSRKRKYTKSTVADLLDGAKQRGNKKLRTESGSKVSGNVAAAASGGLYRKWYERGRKGPARIQANECAHQQGKYRGYDRTESLKKIRGVPRSELRSADEIAKQRRVKAKFNLKNLPRAKRHALVSKA